MPLQGQMHATRLHLLHLARLSERTTGVQSLGPIEPRRST